MNDNNSLPTISSNNPIAESMPVSVDSLIRQVNSIQEAMKAVMQDNVHYGKIPGCGDKPSLLKPGAEKIGLMFRLGASFDIKEVELPANHREFKITCTLTHIPTGQMVGQGVGSCSTMESKFRYVGTELELTDIEVPKAYWDKRDMDILVEAVGGAVPKSSLQPKKVDSKWFIGIKGEKKERKDVADIYNTCLKMAKKRAHVDAIITATAAGDIFTQDVEDMEIPTTTTVKEPHVEVVREAPRAATKAITTSKASSGSYTYEIPYKHKDFDMNEVRASLKANKFRFDMATKVWTGRVEIPKLAPFLVKSESNPSTPEPVGGDEPPPYPDSGIPDSWGDDQDIPF